MAKVNGNIERLICARASASSLIEVTVALIIITMITGFAIMIYLNVQRTGFSTAEIKYNAVLEENYLHAIESSNFQSEELVDNDVVISKVVQPHPSNQRLFILLYEVKNRTGQVLAQKKYLYHAPQ
jgi:hypothetical protein